MTKGEIVTEILDRLNLTSDTAETRVRRLIDRYYLRATTAMGIAGTSRRIFDVEQTVDIGVVEVEFNLMEKVTRVFYITDGEKQFLDEKTIDELRDMRVTATGDTPGKYAVKEIGSAYVIVCLDMLPETAYTIYADGYSKGNVLDDDQEPIFPESYHDILVEGPLIDEYKKLKDLDSAKESRSVYEQRLSDLRMWVNKSAYLKLQQGGRQRSRRRLKDNAGVPT